MGDRFHLAAAASGRGQHVDALVLDQGRIDVEDDQPLGPPAQSGRLDGDVDAGVLGRLHERRSQRRRIRGAHEQLELLAGARDSWVTDSMLPPTAVMR